jgi:hypothetical protein
MAKAKKNTESLNETPAGVDKVQNAGCLGFIGALILIWIIMPGYDAALSMSYKDALLQDKLYDWAGYVVVGGIIWMVYGIFTGKRTFMDVINDYNDYKKQ